MATNVTARIGFPARAPVHRRSLARRDICPECGGSLDTGWECNDCQYDAKLEATTLQNADQNVISHTHLRAVCDRTLGRKPTPPKARR
jgi:tRNA(Ile2) C34 agmatinyltransferase TiaS